ncbi:hypothetical protein [Spiroplasma endosymbiont of Labia minor]|uniref:hypothetical protein n=1 Tax=Spiroplasma endosymbiont of Labia minor TaxID=3066305 RepID=UPI0030CF9D1B
MKLDEKQIKETGLFDLGQNVKTTSLNENFNDDVWLNMILADKQPLDTQIVNVTFANKSRSNWHYHSSAQILIAVAGEGLYCEENKKPQILQKEMVINIPPKQNIDMELLMTAILRN